MARTSAKKASARANAVRRKGKIRNPRTYYGMDKAGTTLFRFVNFDTRQGAVKAEGIVPISALEYRDKMIEDTENKLKIVDRRDTPSGSTFDVNALARRIAAAVLPFINPQTAAPRGARTAGDQPSERAGEAH